MNYHNYFTTLKNAFLGVNPRHYIGSDGWINFKGGLEVYAQKHPELKKQMLGEDPRDVICDHTIGDLRFATNIYPYLEDDMKELNWGYKGSGPYRLALNTLFMFTTGNRLFAELYAWDFVEDFLLAKSQDESLRIEACKIQKWIKNKEANPAPTSEEALYVLRNQ